MEASNSDNNNFPPMVYQGQFGEFTITEGDRLDLITYRTLGDPEQFWQICDANNAMNPVELTEDLGSSLVIPLPQA